METARPHVSIIADAPTPRLAYACQVVFGRLLGWGYRVRALSEAGSGPEDGPVLFYTQAPGPFGLHLRPHGLLSASGTEPVGNLAALEQDLLAAVFWLCTHYAAYSPTHPVDAHGRPLPAYLPGLTDPEVPACHVLAARLAAALGQQGAPARPLEVIHTVDVDNAYAYRGKGPWRWWGGLAKDVLAGKARHVYRRLGAAMGLLADPYDNHARLLGSLHGPGKTVFFLMASHGRYDKAIAHSHPLFAALVARYQQAGWRVGLHPSYGGGQNAQAIRQEAKALAPHTQDAITQTRHHYLRWKIPHTPRLVAELGFTDDYSPGPVVPGFWQGISVPFLWYDVERDEVSGLTLHPAAWMDVHWAMRPAEGIATLQRLWAALKPFGGQLVLIWHNDYFSVFQSYVGQLK